MISPLSEATKHALYQIPAFSNSIEATAWLDWTATNLERLAMVDDLYTELDRMRSLDMALRVLIAASLGFAALFQVFSLLQIQHLSRPFSFTYRACSMLVGCNYLFFRYEIKREKEIEGQMHQLETSLAAFDILSQNQIPRIEQILRDLIPEDEEENSPSQEHRAALRDLQRLKDDLFFEILTRYANRRQMDGIESAENRLSQMG